MRRYKAFISYSWADKEWGQWLHHALETYRAPKGVADGRTLHPIFKDREEEAAGGGIGAAIEAALDASEFLIVVCSPTSATSQWVNREVAWFKKHKSKDRVLALVVSGEPGASVSSKDGAECFPATLLYKVDDNLQPTEALEDPPLAANARKEGDGKRGAKLKIAAALLGVGLDDLVRRDDRRRAERRRLVYAGLASLSLVLGGLSLFAFDQRDAARLAQKDAELQRNEAQAQVEWMLTDFRQKLDAVGRLDILEAVGERLNESYAKQDLATLDADSLGRRARVQLLLGEVEATRGNLDAALKQYMEAANTTEELLRRDPDDQQRIFDHAQSVYWVGDIAWKRGDVALTTAQWIQYRDFGARLVELDPDRDEWRTELGYGHRNLGVLAFTEGGAGDAVEAFSRARDVSKALSEKHAGDANLQIVYADDLIWLASAQEKAGAFAEAEATLAAEAAISGALLAKDPENDMALQRQSVNRRMTARIALEQGNVGRALETLQDLYALHESRLTHDPENTIWLDLYGQLQVDTAEVLLSINHNEAAEREATAALSTARHLLNVDPTVIEWRLRILCGSLLASARVSMANSDLTLATGYVEEALRTVNAIRREKHNSRLTEQFGLIAGVAEARILAIQGKDEAALEKAALAAEEYGVLANWVGPSYQRHLVELFLLANEKEKAIALAESLYANGYRHPDFMKLRAELKF